jgi:exodeoxyribonuclease VII large subunit
MDDIRPIAARSPATNVPEYTVSEISGAVRRALEGNFGRVRVRGEVTELKRYPSGHTYLSLKDEGAKLAGVIWKSALPRLGLSPENGVEVIATGRLTAYAERSSYQLVIERLDYAGAGAMLARIEARRQRLAAEGLFDPSRKQALPVLPRVVGVVTSERGAVIQDIRTTIARRFPRHLLLWPVPVQGEGAAARIAQAIAGFDSLTTCGSVPRPDVLIVARGGGSLEDLMAFNEEMVVRAAALCRIPLISAVGHETDTTLIDFVSDRRAPTPTAAAELAVPVRAELLAGLAHAEARLLGGFNRLAGERRLRLGRAERGLPDLPALLGQARQRLDDRTERLSIALPNLLAGRRTALERVERRLPDLRAILRHASQHVSGAGTRLLLALPNLLAARRSALERIERRLPDPTMLLRHARQHLTGAEARLVLAVPNLIERRHGGLALCGQKLDAGLRHAVGGLHGRAVRTLARLSDVPLRAALRAWRARAEGIGGRLEAVSPLAVLKRGYVVVSDANGHALTESGQVRPGQRLHLRFCDGEVGARADGGQEDRQGGLPL